MVSALSQDYGRQDDVYCAAAHHEDISSSFKVDGLPIFVREPRLGMCLTGTPDQFVALVRTLENGLYSRLGIPYRSGEVGVAFGSPERRADREPGLFP